MKKTVLFLITTYQKTISPDHGFFPILKILGQCRHYPSCSEYTRRCVEKYGATKGILMGLKQLSACHPWGK